MRHYMATNLDDYKTYQKTCFAGLSTNDCRSESDTISVIGDLVVRHSLVCYPYAPRIGLAEEHHGRIPLFDHPSPQRIQFVPLPAH